VKVTGRGLEGETPHEMNENQVRSHLQRRKKKKSHHRVTGLPHETRTLGEIRDTRFDTPEPPGVVISRRYQFRQMGDDQSLAMALCVLVPMRPGAVEMYSKLPSEGPHRFGARIITTVRARKKLAGSGDQKPKNRAGLAHCLSRLDFLAAKVCHLQPTKPLLC